MKTKFDNFDNFDNFDMDKKLKEYNATLIVRESSDIEKCERITAELKKEDNDEVFKKLLQEAASNASDL